MYCRPMPACTGRASGSPVIVHRLIVQGGVDEDVVAALGDKDEVQQTLLRSLKARIEKVKGASYA